MKADEISFQNKPGRHGEWEIDGNERQEVELDKLCLVYESYRKAKRQGKVGGEQVEIDESEAID